MPVSCLCKRLVKLKISVSLTYLINCGPEDRKYMEKLNPNLLWSAVLELRKTTFVFSKTQILGVFIVIDLSFSWFSNSTYFHHQSGKGFSG